MYGLKSTFWGSLSNCILPTADGSPLSPLEIVPPPPPATRPALLAVSEIDAFGIFSLASSAGPVGVGAIFSNFGFASGGRGRLGDALSPATIGASVFKSRSGGVIAGVWDGGRFTGPAGAGGRKLRGAGFVSLEERTSSSFATFPTFGAFCVKSWIFGAYNFVTRRARTITLTFRRDLNSDWGSDQNRPNKSTWATTEKIAARLNRVDVTGSRQLRMPARSSESV